MSDHSTLKCQLEGTNNSNLSDLMHNHKRYNTATPPPSLTPIGLHKVNPRLIEKEHKRPHDETDEFEEINKQLGQLLLDESDLNLSHGFNTQTMGSFLLDMYKDIYLNLFNHRSSYQSHEKLTKNSRKMQFDYQNASPPEKSFIFDQFLKNNIEGFALDKYMHYVLEKVIEVGAPDHKNLIIDRLFDAIPRLIRDLYACKVIQKGLEIICQCPKESQKQLMKFVKFLHQDNEYMRKLYLDRIGNQLVQKALEVFEGEHLYGLLNVLQQYILRDNAHHFELSTDQYGCLIVNKIIDIYPKQFDVRSKEMTNEIIVRAIQNCSCLTRRQYANYIIQQILEKGQEIHKRLLMDFYLIKDFVPMSMDKYGSNVAEKAIVYAGQQWRSRLWEEEVAISDSIFRKLVNDQYANYPMQKLFEFSDFHCRTEILNMLNNMANNNFLNHHGQIVHKFAQLNFHVKKNAQKVQNSQEYGKITKLQEKNKQRNNLKKPLSLASQTYEPIIHSLSEGSVPFTSQQFHSQQSIQLQQQPSQQQFNQNQQQQFFTPQQQMLAQQQIWLMNQQLYSQAPLQQPVPQTIYEPNSPNVMAQQQLLMLQIMMQQMQQQQLQNLSCQSQMNNQMNPN